MVQAKHRSKLPANQRRTHTQTQVTPQAKRARRRFARFYPRGYHDPDYIELERSYKWAAHERWRAALDRAKFQSLLRREQYGAIAQTAVAVESRTNLLFSFEKMAVRDAVKTAHGARTFAEGLHDFLYGSGEDERRFERWCEAVESLPRRGTRVLTWPVLTVFPFIARPDRYIFMKPNVTKEAARAYGFDFRYRSRPNWETYASLVAFAERVRRDTSDWRPRDMIDLQGFIWVQGSEEYDG